MDFIRYISSKDVRQYLYDIDYISILSCKYYLNISYLNKFAYKYHSSKIS